MPEFSNEVQINIKAGEDYTAQITWESDEGEPVPVVGPGRMEIRNDAKALLVHLEDTADISATQGYLSFSTASGVIGIYIPKAVTKTMPTGRHFFDMFVNYERFTVWSDDPQYKPQWATTTSARWCRGQWLCTRPSPRSCPTTRLTPHLYQAGKTTHRYSPTQQKEQR